MAQALWPHVAGRDPDALLFTSETGRMVDQSNLASRVLKPAARRAGVPWASFHTFRHTAASAFFRGGLEREASPARPRASLARVHARTYVHLIPDDFPDAAFLDEGWQQGGNQTDRNQPKSDFAERPRFTVIAGVLPDEPRQPKRRSPSHNPLAQVRMLAGPLTECLQGRDLTTVRPSLERSGGNERGNYGR